MTFYSSHKDLSEQRIHILYLITDNFHLLYIGDVANWQHLQRQCKSKKKNRIHCLSKNER